MVMRAFGTDEEIARQFLLPDEIAAIRTLVKQSLSTNPSLLLAGSLKCRFVPPKPSHAFMIVEIDIPEQPRRGRIRDRTILFDSTTMLGGAGKYLLPLVTADVRHDTKDQPRQVRREEQKHGVWEQDR